MEDSDGNEIKCTYLSTPTKVSWTIQETFAFLNGYLERKNEFSVLRKKKYAFERLRKDLIAQGLLPSDITVAAMENKLKGLVRSYRNPKASKGSAVQIYKPILEDIFGDALTIRLTKLKRKKISLHGERVKPLNSYATLNKSLENVHEYVKEEAEHILPDDDIDINPDAMCEAMPDDIKEEPFDPRWNDPTVSFTRTIPSTSNEIVDEFNGTPYTNAKEDYYERKLQLLKQRQEDKWKMFEQIELNKVKRFKEAEAQKRLRHLQKVALLKKILEKLS